MKHMAGIITEGLLELKDEDYRAFHEADTEYSD